MTERERIANAIEKVLKPLGYRLHQVDGMRVFCEPRYDLLRVWIERLPDDATPAVPDSHS